MVPSPRRTHLQCRGRGGNIKVHQVLADVGQLGQRARHLSVQPSSQAILELSQARARDAAHFPLTTEESQSGASGKSLDFNVQAPTELECL